MIEEIKLKRNETTSQIKENPGLSFLSNSNLSILLENDDLKELRSKALKLNNFIQTETRKGIQLETKIKKAQTLIKGEKKLFSLISQFPFSNSISSECDNLKSNLAKIEEIKKKETLELRNKREELRKTLLIKKALAINREKELTKEKAEIEALIARKTRALRWKLSVIRAKRIEAIEKINEARELREASVSSVVTEKKKLLRMTKKMIGIDKDVAAQVEKMEHSNKELEARLERREYILEQILSRHDQEARELIKLSLNDAKTQEEKIIVLIRLIKESESRLYSFQLMREFLEIFDEGGHYQGNNKEVGGDAINTLSSKELSSLSSVDESEDEVLESMLDDIMKIRDSKIKESDVIVETFPAETTIPGSKKLKKKKSLFSDKLGNDLDGSEKKEKMIKDIGKLLVESGSYNSFSSSGFFELGSIVRKRSELSRESILLDSWVSEVLDRKRFMRNGLAKKTRNIVLDSANVYLFNNQGRCIQMAPLAASTVFVGNRTKLGEKHVIELHYSTRGKRSTLNLAFSESAEYTIWLEELEKRIAKLKKKRLVKKV